MKRKLLACLAVLWLLPNFASAATAQARLFCLSLRFQTATATLFGEKYVLDFTSDISGAALNGELWPLFDATLPSHGTYFLLHDPALGDLTGSLAMALPTAVDANANGYSDFFESSQAVQSSTTQGTYRSQVDDGTITAVWKRDAGSIFGSCALHFESSTFGPLVDFIATFQLLESTGPLTYAPGATNVLCALQLQQTGAPTNLLGGAAVFSKVASDHLNLLTLMPGSWTNGGGQMLVFTNDFYQRNLTTRTNYDGFLDFADGDITTAVADYRTWSFSIDDANDSNGNGIPDFSDDPPTPARAPKLGIVNTSSNLTFSVSGDVGRLHELQEIDSLAQTNWNSRLSLVLTNDPQTFSLPLPAVPVLFWRLHVP